MRIRVGVACAALGLAVTSLSASAYQGARPAAARTPVQGWLDWRGPRQDGVSAERGLPDAVALKGANYLWELPLAGGGSPVIANGKLFALTYAGQGPDLREALVCVDAETGKKLWERYFNDYLSDIIYDRYSIGSPVIDPETGNVYVVTSAGVFSCYTPAGQLVWQHHLMEMLGKLTFPNGRTGAPMIEGDLVIMRGITSNWGGEGPASDRVYGFDKKTGELVWASTPGVRPKDNSFARPVVATRKGHRVLYTGTGCGHIACLDARTGRPIWKFPLSAGGLNSSVVLYKDRVIGIHADENLDNSEIGRQVAVRVDAEGEVDPAGGAPLLNSSAELWRNKLESISSSPVLVGNRLYQVNKTGSLCSVSADDGSVAWKMKLGPDQLHASPTYADGKLYIPLQNGSFYIIRPEAKSGRQLCKVQLAGRCLGAPAIWKGRVYVLSTERLYCFGKKAPGPAPAPVAEPRPQPGPATALQIIPAEVLLKPGGKVSFRIRGIDENGVPTGWLDPRQAKWAKYIPPTARVRSEMNGSFNADGQLVAADVPTPSAGAWQATIGELKGTIRGRVLPALPLRENFEAYKLEVDHATEGVKFAYPPLPWIGARFKFEVRDLDGDKVLAKTLDNVFFQRATVFLGSPEMKNYTFTADVRSDGNRRTQSTVGIINQRYVVSLVGNSQELEVSSNHERIKVAVPFKWASKTWYTLKARVDVAANGSGVVRAKAWVKREPEPAAWTIQVPHKHAHASGAPGLFGFSPQSLFRVYVDNLSVTPN